MKNVSPYIKMRVLGAVEHAQGRTIRERIKAVSAMDFEDEPGRRCRFTWRTISTWLYRYKISGVTSMQPKPRSDRGKTRKIAPEAVQEAIDQALPSFRGKHPAKAHIYRKCLEMGLLHRDRIARTTFSRFVDRFEMLKPDAEVHNKRRLAFSKQYANQMWQADTMYGPHVREPEAPPRPTFLIAFIDDASRLLVHGEFFFAENADSIRQAFRSALYKRGVPDQLYVDNGSVYSSREIIAVCARIGCLLGHAPVRDGAAKGKIERFFRTVREEFLERNLDLSSLHALNRQFTAWAEDVYNARPHSTTQMRPIDRFALDLKRVRYLPSCEANDELFHVEEDRRVRADNTFSFRNTRYEAPCDLRNRNAQVRFDRLRPTRVVVYYKEQRMGEARPLDFVANDRPPRALASTGAPVRQGERQ